MVNIRKFYNEETVEVNGEKIIIRAYRLGDGPIVADMLDKKFEADKLVEDIKNEKVEDDLEVAKRFSRFRTEIQELAIVLASRGLMRSIEPETRKYDIDELDEHITNEDFELDPEYALPVAWAMIALGLPKPSTKVDDTKKPKQKRKTSQPKTSSKT